MEASQSNSKVCSTCQAADVELLKCTRCKTAYYCNVNCQKQDWPKHKLICSKSNATKEEPKEDLTGMNEFHKVQHIGTGNFTTIFKAVSKIDGNTYAIKQAEKEKLKRVRKEEDLFMEKHCLNKLKDWNYAVRLYKTFQDPIHLFLQMECPEGGELWDQARFYGIAGESLYKYYVSHLIKAVSTLHDKYEIIHRDLKPENVLLTKDHQLKLIDFGTAKDLSRPDLKGSGNGLKGRTPFYHYVGTPHYMAPECIHNKASQKISDVYSLSGLLYFLKVGSAPFAAGSEYLIFTKSLEKELTLPKELCSASLIDLIHKMNKKDMSERLPLDQAMSHEYFEGVDFENLPTYQQALEKLTPLEKKIHQICQHLIEKYVNLHKEDLETRQKVYNTQILPYLEEWVNQAKSESVDIGAQVNDLKDVICVQTQVMINLPDDINVGFAQLYKKLRGIEDPVIVKQLNEEEIELPKIQQALDEVKIEEVTSKE